MKLIYATVYVSIMLNLLFFMGLIHTENARFKLEQAYESSMNYIESQARTHIGARNPAYICKTKK